jgi:hypothetical protein
MQQIVQDLVTARASAIEDSIMQMEAAKVICDRAVLAKDYREISACVFIFQQVPTVACSGLTQPIYDFLGRRLQNIADMNQPLQNMSFTLLPNGSGGIAAFVWLQDADSVCRPFVSSLLGISDDRKSDALVQLVFDSFENHAAQPDWWDGLPDETRAELRERMLNWTDIRPINYRALVLGDRRFADWRFETARWL